MQQSQVSTSAASISGANSSHTSSTAHTLSDAYAWAETQAQELLKAIRAARQAGTTGATQQAVAQAAGLKRTAAGIEEALKGIKDPRML